MNKGFYGIEFGFLQTETKETLVQSNFSPWQFFIVYGLPLFSVSDVKVMFVRCLLR